MCEILAQISFEWNYAGKMGKQVESQVHWLHTTRTKFLSSIVNLM